jgi:hypothetical protein
MSGDPIEVEAVVDRFDHQAMVDHGPAGAFTAYSATSLRVVSPERFRGRVIRVFHDQAEEIAAVWRATDSRVRCRVEEADLGEAVQLFTGAVTDIREVGE